VNKAADKSWWFHPFLKKASDDATHGDAIADPNKWRPQTSCSVTKPVDATSPKQWWKADFKEGDLTIEEVELWGEHYHTIWDRAMYGVKVLIGGKYCNTIKKTTINEKFKKMTDGEGNGYRVICVKPVKGNSITIETKRPSKKADTY